MSKKYIRKISKCYLVEEASAFPQNPIKICRSKKLAEHYVRVLSPKWKECFGLDLGVSESTFYEDLDYTTSIVDVADDDVVEDEIIKENKQLKSRINDYDEMHSKILDTLSDLEKLEDWKWEDLLTGLDKIAVAVGWQTELFGLEKDYTGSYIEEIEDLKKENEQLKQQIKELNLKMTRDLNRSLRK